MIATLVNISKKFILNNHIVNKYKYKIDIIKSINIYNIYNIYYIYNIHNMYNIYNLFNNRIHLIIEYRQTLFENIT